MKYLLEKYKKIVVQIATPYSTGTGFFIKDWKVIVTNEHIIQGNKSAAILAEGIPNTMVNVLYADAQFDIAFLEMPKGYEIPEVVVGNKDSYSIDSLVIGFGHPAGEQFLAENNRVTGIEEKLGDIDFLKIEKALNIEFTGGPLINLKGEIIGINAALKAGKEEGLCISVVQLQTAWDKYKYLFPKISRKCDHCQSLITAEMQLKNKSCSVCKNAITLPSQETEYEPKGVARTIEYVIKTLGHDVSLSRRGPTNWAIEEGSATINLAYYEPKGYITADAILCELPEYNLKPIYEFLLQQNDAIRGLTFSIRERDIVLSLIIYDKNFNIDTATKLIKTLLERADYYDNVLVEELGAKWKV